MRTLINLSLIFAGGVFLLLQINATTNIPFLSIIICIGMLGSFIGTLAGGGGLITLPAMLLLGIPIHFSIATNKFSSGIASLSSLFVLLKTKELNMKIMKSYIISSIIGGGFGALVTSILPEKWLNLIAICLLIFTFFVSIKSKKWYSELQANNTNLNNNRASKVMSFFIGMYDGGFGPGSSTFSILYFIKSKNTYVKATQMSRVLNFGSCFGAFIIFYQTGYLQWDYAIALGTGSIIGTQVALKIVSKIPLKIAKGLVTTILILLIVQVAWQFK
ncbi:sulfite exporter TauE/SafE family protein [Lysinibacillus sphaericus]|uniref:sulfite exporter TauE/SafE family protein n=1 Tax=Lysinibacillus sphaericus TaxID=1421 RepID=UPI001E628B0B|nr:sulfite exporter TauE/SafE family protein [Lysinibacillus sphaericus]MCS1384828.1 sulfite exporter TauE/SafE family protein [Lysinibacillus sphaericus]